MKVTVQINNEPLKITLTQEQLVQIEAQKRLEHLFYGYCALLI